MHEYRRNVCQIAVFVLATASGHRGSSAVSSSALQPTTKDGIDCSSGFWGGCRPRGEDLYSGEYREVCEMMTTCSSHGRCVGSTGKCRCYNGWYGEFCNMPMQCPDGYSGAECQTCFENIYSGECSHSCDMISSCSGHGRCIGSTGKCLSSKDWRLPPSLQILSHVLSGARAARDITAPPSLHPDPTLSLATISPLPSPSPARARAQFLFHGRSIHLGTR